MLQAPMLDDLPPNGSHFASAEGQGQRARREGARATAHDVQVHSAPDTGATVGCHLGARRDPGRLDGADRRRRRQRRAPADQPTSAADAATSWPNLVTQQRTASRLASIPRWASSSSTSRALSVNLKYSHTAYPITSGGKRCRWNDIGRMILRPSPACLWPKPKKN